MAGWNKVQSFVTTFSSSIPVTTFPTTAPVSGNLLVCIMADNGSNTISAPTGTLPAGSSAYTLVATKRVAAVHGISIYYATAPAGLTTTYTVTGHYTASVTGEMFVSEWNGNINPGAVNSSQAGSTGSNSNGLSGLALTVSSANCLVVAGVVDTSGANPATFTTQSGWQKVDSQLNGVSFMAAAVACKPTTGSSALSTGSYQSTWTLEGAGAGLSWVGMSAAFLPDGVGGAVAAAVRQFTLLGAGH